MEKTCTYFQSTGDECLGYHKQICLKSHGEILLYFVVLCNQEDTLAYQLIKNQCVAFVVLSFRHGDMLFLSREASPIDNDMSGVNSVPLTSAANLATLASSNSIKEDEIDVFLSKQDGLIHRDRDPQL